MKVAELIADMSLLPPDTEVWFDATVTDISTMSSDKLHALIVKTMIQPPPGEPPPAAIVGMKLYVATIYTYYEDSEIVGIFQTRAAAEAALAPLGDRGDEPDVDVYVLDQICTPENRGENNRGPLVLDGRRESA